MMSLKEATQYAKRMTKLHGKKWIVFKTPDAAQCNQGIAAVYNTGRYAACEEAEREIYEQGGAEFVA